MSESSLRVIVLLSLVYPYFEHDIDSLVNNQAAGNWMNQMSSLLSGNS